MEWLSPTILMCKSKIPESIIEQFFQYFEQNNHRLWEDSMIVTIAADEGDDSVDPLRRGSEEVPEVDNEFRKVKISNDTKTLTQYYSMMDELLDECVEEYVDRYTFYGEILSQKSDYTLMRYDEGSFYKEHIGVSNLEDDDDSSHRKIAIYVFLNDDYDGGELNFLYQNIEIKPKRGDVIIFDCGALHPHECKEVVSGSKYMICNWLS